jgi:hypothetical protein
MEQKLALQLVSCSKSKITEAMYHVPVYVLKVRWCDPNYPFAEDGDSGSLIFANDGEVIVPLGSGSRDTISYSLSLWSLCEVKRFRFHWRLIYYFVTLVMMTVDRLLPNILVDITKRI